jgi:S-sulfo-L-cysteine synthase (O-acetyl-L-serine-dependent)
MEQLRLRASSPRKTPIFIFMPINIRTTRTGARMRITHFVAMLGTTGTFVGTTRRLKELNPTIRCVSLQPDSAFHGIEGAKHLPSAIVPRIYDSSLADENLEISTEAAHGMARRLAREQGLLVGVSAAAAIVGSLDIIERLKKNQHATVVTILCDSGEKYLSERFWSEE